MRNRVQPDLDEILGEAVARIRAMRRQERIAELTAAGWSREAAVAHVYGGGMDVVGAWLDDQDLRRTKRFAQNKPLSARPSVRKRRPPRRWRRWWE